MFRSTTRFVEVRDFVNSDIRSSTRNINKICDYTFTTVRFVLLRIYIHSVIVLPARVSFIKAPKSTANNSRDFELMYPMSFFLLLL